VSVPGPEVAPKTAPVENVNPADIRFSQNTAGGKGRADVLRQSMGEKGWAGDPVDAVRTPDGITTIDNTRVAVARELGIKEIPVRVHAPNEPLPPDMIGRFGDAKTWGEALAQRTGNQKPPLPPPGTPDASRMPKPKE
jgi:filamentous hemagglutinin